MTGEYRDIAAAVREAVMSQVDKIELAGTFGMMEDDLDVLVIAREVGWSTIHALCEGIRQVAPEATCFAYSRHHSFVRYLAGEGRALVHLRYYSSMTGFVCSIREFVCRSILRGLKPWTPMREYPDLVPTPIERIAHIHLDHLCETAVPVLCSSLPEQLAVDETRRAVATVTKFLPMEIDQEDSAQAALLGPSAQRLLARVRGPEPGEPAELLGEAMAIIARLLG